MRVPEIAARMRELADKLKLKKLAPEADELVELAGELRRRNGGPRAASSSTPMTPELVQEIRDFAKSNPSLSQQAIAEQFNVNHGRVSEAIRGKRM